MVGSSRPEQKLASTLGENGNSGLAMISIESELLAKCYQYEEEERKKKYEKKRCIIGY